MITADSVAAKLRGLIARANEASGNNDTDLTAAVDSLIAGFGQGGGGGDESALFTAVNNDALVNFVATEDMVKLRDYAFYGRKALKTADLSKLMPSLSGNKYDARNMLGTSCFAFCEGLESVILPEFLATPSASWIGKEAFRGCTSLKEFCTEYAAWIYSSSPSAFHGCTALEKVIIPNFTGNGFSNYFNGCSNLRIVDFSSTAIGPSCFLNCGNLKTVVIRTATMASIQNINAFNGTPFAVGGAGGTVYVPQALIESYQQATNWSTMYAAGTCNFVAIEGSECE